jgi:hypothetical protein
VPLKIIISLLFNDAQEEPDRDKDVEKDDSRSKVEECKLSMKFLKAGGRLRRNTIPRSPTTFTGK